MTVIQPLLITLLTTDLSNHLNKAKVKINGADVDFTIFETKIEGTKVRTYVYVVDQTGDITDARLLDLQGRELATESLSIKKEEDGIMIVFEFTLNITAEVV